MKKIEVYIDGGCRKNPGEGAFGFVIRDDKGGVFQYGEKLSKCTNNIAEYQALIGALKYLIENGVKSNERIIIYSDSELLVKQMNKEYRVRSRNLLPLFSEANKLKGKFNNIRIKHIKRENNYLADLIVKRVFDKKAI